MRAFAIDTITLAETMSAARTSSMLTAPPTGPTRYRASTPPVIAPNDAPAPMSPNNRFACRVSKSELAKLHACTGAMMPKQLTQTKKTPGSNSNGWNRNAYQNSTTWVAKNSSVTTVSSRDADAGDGAVVQRHEERQRDRHRGVDVHQRVGPVLFEKEAVPDGFREQERGDDDGDVKEGEKDRQTLARSDVEKAAQPQQHGVSAVYFSFCIA